MSNVIGIALSGLNAASARLANSANNVANAQTVSEVVGGRTVKGAFTPSDVTQRAVSPTGGVETGLRARNPATIPVADGSGNVVDTPNVDLPTEAVDQQFASYDFKANLKVLKAQDEMQKSLLDIYA